MTTTPTGVPTSERSDAALRRARIERSTRETSITADLVLDGSGRASVKTGIGFLDHMLATLALFARFDLDLIAQGDLHVDDHHTSEDCFIVLGQAIDRALGDRTGLVRFGHAYAPLDEALARAVVDLATRITASIDLGLTRPTIGQWACENITHALTTLATSARFTLHVDVLKGANDHHRAEAAFKALGLALRDAVRRDPTLSSTDVSNSTKGVL
ncbi:MAG: imidazoleglycerol-phosphate dehydratase [Phycisphaeraceae bacterium]|nr:imidazoleglycerol-phosphate dehydratase [Phycisphaeraceae bacterium]MBX3366043.1 imidazoleglycerol-phosphate dehydratase [Phycisphaeraceae bacterium]